MLNKTKKLIPVIITVGAMIAPAAVFGQNLVPAELSQTADPIKVIRGLIRLILVIAFILAFVMLIVGGIRWILAGGDEKAVGSARGTITAALIGLVIVLVAYAIIRLVEVFFNVTIISATTIPNINTP